MTTRAKDARDLGARQATNGRCVRRYHLGETEVGESHSDGGAPHGFVERTHPLALRSCQFPSKARPYSSTLQFAADSGGTPRQKAGNSELNRKSCHTPVFYLHSLTRGPAQPRAVPA